MSNALSDSNAVRPLRVLFFGMQSNFSIASLAALLASGITVCAIIVPATPLPGKAVAPIQLRAPHVTRARLTMVGQLDMLELAHARNIPLWEVQQLKHADTIAILSSYQPDIICVACFSRLIPRCIIDLARLTSLNVHPSLLPANRGPVPLFWTFREGHRSSGVTIHALDEKMDSGAIFAQETLAVTDGMRYEQLEARCAERGGVLLARTIWELHAGRATSTMQDETKSSYNSFPTAADFVVHANAWSAQPLYNFIRGTGDWEQPIEVHSAGQRYLVRDAISYSLENEQRDERVARQVGRERVITIDCRVGWVEVVLEELGAATS